MSTRNASMNWSNAWQATRAPYPTGSPPVHHVHPGTRRLGVSCRPMGTGGLRRKVIALLR